MRKKLSVFMTIFYLAFGCLNLGMLAIVDNEPILHENREQRRARKK